MRPIDTHEINTSQKPRLHIYPVRDANNKVISYEMYSENCTKPVIKLGYVGNIVIEEVKK